MGRIKIDRTILTSSLALAGFSLALIWSTYPSLFVSQLLFFLIGMVIMLVVSQIHLNIFRSLSLPFFILSTILLSLTLLHTEVRGASRWLFLGDFRLQPSEILKPFFILSAADIIARKNKNIKNYLLLFLIIVLPFVIIFLQPDLGNVIIYVLFYFSMLFINNLNLYLIGGIITAIAVASPLIWKIFHDYQKQRILSFLNPALDPQGTGYNAMQAIIAVGSGLLLGRGLGRGSQSHLRFLPESHTDFIFSSLAEELGFLGSFVVLVIYLVLLLRMLNLAASENNKFEFILMIGIITQIYSQVIINTAMNLGMLPITGVTLPLLSAGGSSVLATFIALGLFISASKDRHSSPLVIR